MLFTATNQYSFKLISEEGNPFITMEVKGCIPEKEFREKTLQMFDFFNQMNADKLLIDAREMGYISYFDQKWLTDYFIPYACVNGLKAVSFIKPQDYHTRLCIENIMYEIPAPLLPAAWFTKDEEAREWLTKLEVNKF